MLQRFLFAWQPSTVIVSTIFTLIVLGIAEWMASRARDGDFAYYGSGALVDADTSAYGGVNPKAHSHIFYSFGRRSLPNYWYAYKKEAVYEAIEAQGLAITTFILSIVVSAALAAPALCVGLVSAFMFFAVRVFPPQSRLNWLWVVPVVGMLLDVAEDVLLLVITLGHPFRQYPLLMDVMRTASYVKHAIVVFMALATLATAGVFAVRGRRAKEANKVE